MRYSAQFHFPLILLVLAATFHPCLSPFYFVRPYFCAHTTSYVHPLSPVICAVMDHNRVRVPAARSLYHSTCPSYSGLWFSCWFGVFCMSMHAFPSGFICYGGGANKKLDYDVLYCICSWACRVRISFFVGADFEVDRQTTTVDAADGCRGHPGCGRGTTMYSQRWLDQRRIRVSPTAISLSPPNRSGVTFKPRAQTQIRPLRWHGGRIKRQGG